MTHHTAAYRLAVLGTVANTQITAVVDSMLTIRGGNFFLPSPMRLLYAYFGSADSVRARLVTPTWRTIAPKQIVPVSSAILPPSPSPVMDLRSNPLMIPANQSLALDGTDGTGTTVGLGVIGLEIDNRPAPGGEVFTIRAVGGTTVVAGAWTSAALTFDDTLPPGRYVVVGMRAVGVTAVAARIITSGDFWRPGCIATAVPDAVPDKMFSANGLGWWTDFENTTLPQVEFFCNAADTAQTVFFDIIKVQ